MKSKRIVITLIATIMLFSTVACGTTNQAEESKSTDTTTKEVTTTSTVAPTEATTAATEATTQAVTQATTKAQDNRELINTLGLKFDDDFKFSEETLKNIKDYFEGNIWTNGECFDLSQVQFTSDEYNSMEYFAFNIWQSIFIRKISSSNYLEPYLIDYNAKTQLEVTYDSKTITVKLFMI